MFVVIHMDVELTLDALDGDLEEAVNQVPRLSRT